MAQNMATQKMVENIIDGTTPPKKVKNPLSINVNGLTTTYDGSEGKTVVITHPTNAVNFTAQTLTDSQKEQARSNIGAASQTAVETAQSTADTAKTNASKAQTAADTAKADAATAQAAAEGAQGTADTNTSEINKIKSGATLVGQAGHASTAENYDLLNGNIKQKFASVDSEVEAAKTAASNAQTTADNAGQAAENAQTTANEAKSIATGRARAVTYSTIQAMYDDLNSLAKTELKIGDNIFIVDKDVPDFWVVVVNNTSTTGTVPSDFNAQYYNVGYFSLCKLETQKVDLSNYATNETVQTVDDRVDKIIVDLASGAITPQKSNIAVNYDTAGGTIKTGIETAQATATEAKNQATTNAENIADIIDGTTSVPKATTAQTATTATKATTASNYDTTSGTIKDKFAEVDSNIEDIVDGTTYVQNARNATNAQTATSANQATSAFTALNYNEESGTIKEKFDGIDESISTLDEDVKTAQETADTANTTAANAQSQASQNATNISNLQAQVNERPTNSEVDSKIQTAIDGVVDGADDAFNTLKEVADWIKSDETGTSALVTRVSTNETDIADLKEYAQNHCVMKTVVLSVASWSNKIQTISESTVKATSLVKAYPLSNDAAVINNGVSLSAQSAGTIVFSCTSVPTADITYQLEIYNVTSLA